MQKFLNIRMGLSVFQDNLNLLDYIKNEKDVISQTNCEIIKDIIENDEHINYIKNIIGRDIVVISKDMDKFTTKEIYDKNNTYGNIKIVYTDCSKYNTVCDYKVQGLCGSVKNYWGYILNTIIICHVDGDCLYKKRIIKEILGHELIHSYDTIKREYSFDDINDSARTEINAYSFNYRYFWKWIKYFLVLHGATRSITDNIEDYEKNLKIVQKNMYILDEESELSKLYKDGSSNFYS